MPSNAPENLSDHELRLAIAKEVLGLKRVRCGANGRITGDHPTVLTTMPVRVPDWMENERQLIHLEAIVIREAGGLVHREELGRIAGAFNPRPTPRQRCEAVLSAARRVRSDVITSAS